MSFHQPLNSFSLILSFLIPSSSHTNIPDSSILSCLPFFNRLLYHRTAVVWCDPWAGLHISYATHRQYLGVPESKTAQSILADSNSLTWHIQQSTSPWAQPGIADKPSSVWMHCLYSCYVRLFCCVNAVYELVALSVLTRKSLRRYTCWSSVQILCKRSKCGSKKILILFWLKNATSALLTLASLSELAEVDMCFLPIFESVLCVDFLREGVFFAFYT